jgi:quinol monooxygenase YgiN
MEKFALFVRLDAKPGKEADLERLLNEGRSLVQEESKTAAWYALRLGPLSFGIFDTFLDEEGRRDHLSGRVAAALMERGPELLEKKPVIEFMSIISEKAPAYTH